MAVFQHNNRSIPYRIELAPFNYDLVLLQSSRSSADFFKPLIASFTDVAYGGGRVLTCEWADGKREDTEVAKDFVNLMRTLALVSVRVVAFGDAVEMVSAAQKLQPSLFEKTLFFPEGGPKDEALTRAVFDLCQL